MKASLLEKELVKVANSMPWSQFLRTTRKVTRDIERPRARDGAKYCYTCCILASSFTLRDNEVQEVPDDPFGNDSNCFVAPGGRS